jgi:hypothetical protein
MIKNRRQNTHTGETIQNNAKQSDCPNKKEGLCIFTLFFSLFAPSTATGIGEKKGRAPVPNEISCRFQHLF